MYTTNTGNTLRPEQSQALLGLTCYRLNRKRIASHQHRALIQSQFTFADSSCHNRPAAPPRCAYSEFGTLPFRIYKVQHDGGLHFVEAMQTFHDAKQRVRALGEIWPGHYVIDNEETGQRLFINTMDETKN